MAKGIAHRDWALHRSDYETDVDFRAAVEQESALNVHIQERLGVAIVAGPIRRQYPGGTWYTEAYRFQTASLPSARDPEPVVVEPEPALVEDPDPLAHVE